MLSVSSVATVYMQDIIEQLIDVMLSNAKSKKSYNNYFINLMTSFEQKYF